MVLAVDFSGLNVWTDALATILLLELCVLLLIIAALILVLALGARWLQMHVVPVLNTTVPVAKQALEVTNQSTDRVVHGVAEVYGIRSAVETAARIILFGKDGARRTSGSTSTSQTVASPPAEVHATPSQVETRTSPVVGRIGPSIRRTLPQTADSDPRQPSQPYDNMAAHAG